MKYNIKDVILYRVLNTKYQLNGDNMKNKGIRFLTQAAIIAAIYATLTIVLGFMSFGVVQVRIAEALCILPFFTPAAIPGLFVGCFIGNLFGPNLGIWDIIGGSLATLVSAYLASKIKIKWLVPLPAVIINAVWVGYLLYKVLELHLLPSMGSVALGQIVACYVIGLPLLLILERYGKKIFT